MTSLPLPLKINELINIIKKHHKKDKIVFIFFKRCSITI